MEAETGRGGGDIGDDGTPRLDYPPPLCPSVHPMVNLSKPALKDASALVETIRHTRQASKYSNGTAAVPSVTKILQETMSDKQRQILQAWEDRMVKEMGRPAFEEMKRATFRQGERFHALVDQYMQSGDIDSTQEDDQVTNNHVKSIMHVLDR